MKKFSVAVLSLVLLLCAAPAFGWHKKAHKDPRFAQHPKAYHPKNEQLKHAPKHKITKHHA